MPLVIGYDEAKQRTLKRNNQLGYFNFPNDPDMPHASLNGHEPGAYFNEAHFHENDQFQVVIDGKFKIGKHELTPYCIHFTRAHTPYGPLVSDGCAFSFMVMRAHRDAGAQPLSEHGERLMKIPNRRPWQVSQAVTFPAPDARPASAQVLLNEVPNVKDDQGLAAYTMVLKPNAHADAPDPSRGDGQYVMVLKGSFIHDNREHKALGMVFVKPHEGPFRLQAGAEGLEALVLNFPEVKRRPAEAKVASAPGFRKWQCILCAFAYDEALGMPEDGIAPGTRWEDVPETWTCPDCSANKGDFEMVEV
jgi:rubredoxin